jgi:hypothetical protein
MLKAKHNMIIYPFFQVYNNFILKKHFKEIRFIGEIDDLNRPILLISNHISWWDGFWHEYFNIKYFKRKYHFMMLEEQLRRHWFLNYCGGFSVRKKSRSIIESINYTVEILKDNRNMVLIFPQGEIQSMQNKTIVFENGIEHILNKVENPIQICFVANLVDYFSDPKPTDYFYFQEYKEQAFDVDSLQKSYNNFYCQCVENQKKIET